jgi:hypothetical protein
MPDTQARYVVKPPQRFADNGTVNMPFTPHVRAALLVLVLAFAAAGAGLMVLGRAQDSNDASPSPTKPATATPRTNRPTPATGARPHSTATRPAVRDRLPAAIQQPLSANRVVVVMLFDPKAKIDDTALREASAGAQLAGSTFVPVDVTTRQVDALNLRYGVIQDPAVLVLRPPGDLVVRIDGFADRATVAQAAANAAS